MNEAELKLTRELFNRHMVWILMGTIIGRLWSACVFETPMEIIHGTVFAFFLSGIAVFDIKYGLVFDRWLLGMLGCAVLLHFMNGYDGWISSLICAAAALVLLLFLRIITRGGMGGGDIKLAFVLGFWLSWPKTLAALVFAFWLGGAVAVFLLMKRKKTMKSRIPFGPFLAAGAWLAFLYGNTAWAWIQGI